MTIPVRPSSSGRSGHGLRRRWLRVAILAWVMFVAVPAALAFYTGTYAPTQAVVPQQLPTVSTGFTCSANGLGGTVTLNWPNTNSTPTDPYGGTVIDGYRLERSLDGGAFTTISSPAVGAISATDNNFGGLALNTKLTYQIRTTRSLWTSAPSASVSGRVTGFSIVNLVTCPHA